MTTSLYKLVLSCRKVVGGDYKFVQACIVCRKVVGGDYKFVQACVIL